MKHAACFAVLSMLTACASTAANDEISERVKSRLAQFEATGETRSCLSVSQIRSITPLDERHFLVRTGASQFYLNKPSRGCFGADEPFNRLQYNVMGGQLCRNEIITVVDNTTGLTGGSCGLGDFERLEEKAAE